MRRLSSICVATWILDHATPGSRNESLAGDLMEEFQSGRSAFWYWRQVFSAVTRRLISTSSSYFMPTVFAVAWSNLYSVAWPTVVNSSMARAFFEKAANQDWPYSSGMHAVSGITPASLSISLNVLCVTTIGQRLLASRMTMHEVSRNHLNSSTFALCAPLAASLFSGVICVLSPMRPRQGTRSIGA